MKNYGGCLALIALLGGCATPSAKDISDVRPTNYDQAVRAYIESDFMDPDSVRRASVTDPFPASVSWDNLSLPTSAWAVCLQANARNRMGGYTGQQYTLLRLDHGHVTAAVHDEQYGSMAVLGQAHQNCPGRTYRPIDLSHDQQSATR